MNNTEAPESPLMRNARIQQEHTEAVMRVLSGHEADTLAQQTDLLNREGLTLPSGAPFTRTGLWAFKQRRGLI